MRKATVLILITVMLCWFSACKQESDMYDRQSADSDSTEKNVAGSYKLDTNGDIYDVCVLEIELKESKCFAVISYKNIGSDEIESLPLLECDANTEDEIFNFVNESGNFKITVTGEDTVRLDAAENGELLPFDGVYRRTESAEMQLFRCMKADVPKFPEVKVDRNCDVNLDSTLAIAVRESLGMAENSYIDFNTLAEVTELRAFETPVTSLTGIENMQNLELLSITSCYITDADVLNKLPKLKSIDISWSYLKNIPDLSNCKDLEELRLTGGLIEDISNLKKIPWLKLADLSGNRFNSLLPISDITFLESLCIANDNIIDYKVIENNDKLCCALDKGNDYTVKEALEVEKFAEKTVSEITDKSMSELEKCAVIYSYIIKNTDFNDSDYKGYAFGARALLKHEGVCGNYAEAFALLAQHAGINVILVSSDEHMWNMAEIDGAYYNMDTLWDEDNIIWKYFGRSADYILTKEFHNYDLRRYPYADRNLTPLQTALASRAVDLDGEYIKNIPFLQN